MDERRQGNFFRDAPSEFAAPKVGIETGRRLRDDALDLLNASNADWVQWMRKVAVAIAVADGRVSTDELHAVADRYGRHPKEPRAYGAVFRPHKYWTKIEYKTSDRPECHARPIAVWRFIR